MKEKDNLITGNQKRANLFNIYFINITDTLQSKKLPLKFHSLSLKLFLFMRIMKTFLKSKKKKKKKKKKSFQKNFVIEVSSNEVKKVTKSLNRKKCAISFCIPVSILINSMDIYLLLLTDIINDSLKRAIFPDELKLAEVIPLSKKADSSDKTNYWPVSLLSHISNVFERVIYNQINEYIECLLSKVLTGFCKKHNTLHSLLKRL